MRLLFLLPINFLKFITFLSSPANWRVMVDLALVSMSGGIYILPLYAIMQQRSDRVWRSRVIACNNILNALFIYGDKCCGYCGHVIDAVDHFASFYDPCSG
jgi:hypothetical protein